MTKNLFRLLLCVLMLSSAIFGSPRPASEDAKQHASAQGPSSEPAKQRKPKTDACGLLTSADIQAVQGDPVQETKPSTQPGDGLIMSQCLFRTATPSKSVSVAMASPGSISPRTFWQKQFHSGKSSTEEKEKAEKKPIAGSKKQEKEEDDESTRPRAIAGVGEEAYWVGGPMVGALYVLKGNTFVRISVGGVREEPARIEKSVALARLALKRL